MIMMSELRRLVFSLEEQEVKKLEKKLVQLASAGGQSATAVINLLLNVLPFFSPAYCRRYGF